MFYDRHGFLFDFVIVNQGNQLMKDPEAYTWIPKLVLNLIISFMTCIFFLFFNVKIKKTLEKSIAFLSQSNNATTSNAAKAYRKIISFSFMICCIFLAYNFLFKLLESSHFVAYQLAANGKMLLS